MADYTKKTLTEAFSLLEIIDITTGVVRIINTNFYEKEKDKYFLLTYHGTGFDEMEEAEFTHILNEAFRPFAYEKGLDFMVVDTCRVKSDEIPDQPYYSVVMILPLANEYENEIMGILNKKSIPFEICNPVEEKQ